jgi:3-hydroxyisobutyrate dehydrogenase-like beta-hydroxyacid dehydrogenase
MFKDRSQIVALLGVGLMGSALGKAILNAGYTLNIWNRTRDKCSPLASHGANICQSPEAAIAASDIIILVMSNYATTMAVIADAPLSGKTVVQVATGSIDDAVALEEFCTARQSSAYMEVKVMTYPDNIGTQKGLLLASGRRDVYVRLEALFASLGACRLAGENVSAATSLMFAWCVQFQVSLAGVLETISAAEALGVDPGIVFEIASLVGNDVDGVVARWHDATARTGPPPPAQSAPVTGYLEAMDLVLSSTRRAGIQLPVSTAVRSTFGRWADQGFGSADIEHAFQAARLQQSQS